MCLQIRRHYIKVTILPNPMPQRRFLTSQDLALLPPEGYVTTESSLEVIQIPTCSFDK